MLAAAALAAGTGRADSDLLIDYPGSFGPIAASTYDVDRKQVGEARLVVEKLDNGNVRISSESGFTGGARTIATAELVPAEGNNKLRPVLQESRSFDPDGNALARRMPSIEDATDFVNDRLGTYERMWDGCGCKINYFE